MLKSILHAAALAAAVLASVPALAQEAQTRIVVSYADLDLSKPADVKRFDRRLAHAIAEVCPSGEGLREMKRLRSVTRCHAAEQAEIAAARQTALASAQAGKATFATAP